MNILAYKNIHGTNKIISINGFFLVSHAEKNIMK